MNNCKLPDCFPVSYELHNNNETFEMTCPPGQVLKGGLCYEDEGVGTVPQIGCPPNTDFKGGLCYKQVSSVGTVPGPSCLPFCAKFKLRLNLRQNASAKCFQS